MFIKSPINYTWNKYRLLEQFSKYIPKKTGLFVDLFCWWATVGFNVNADKVILIDSNQRIINLLKTLAENDINKIISTVEKLIDNYGLSYSNLKNKNTFKANMMLYTLMVYWFNNDIRFNRYWTFNLPVWKTDFNKNNYDKLVAYNQRAKEINYEFICWDFRDKKIKEILYKADFVYSDPPYLITDAVYNEQNWWTKEEETALLDLLKELDSMWKSFALSNVTQKKWAKNELLLNWIKENKYKKHLIDYHYRSASYNKKNRDWNEEEVLVTNK